MGYVSKQRERNEKDVGQGLFSEFRMACEASDSVSTN